MKHLQVKTEENKKMQSEPLSWGARVLKALEMRAQGDEIFIISSVGGKKNISLCDTKGKTRELFLCGIS